MEIDLISSPSPPPDSSDPNPSTTTTTTTISPSSRIAELNQIDTQISTLLNNASTATSILANHTTSSSLTTAQRTFTTAASNYFSTLSSIEVRLRRQVYALEEAGLIQAGDERDARRGRTLNSDDGSIRRGGGGPLDPSWLNARVSEGVENGMKRKLLTLAKEVVEKGKNGDEDTDMDQDQNGKG